MNIKYEQRYATESYVNDEVDKLSEAIGELDVQADWNQNDETAKDYVKNRPFYESSPTPTEILPESTMTFFELNGLYACDMQVDFVFEVGQTYIVNWNGSEYTCVAFAAGDGSVGVLGDVSIMSGGESTGEPFLMTSNNGYFMSYAFDVSSTEETRTLSIVAYVSEIIKIPEKFLPFTSDELVSYVDSAITEFYKNTKRVIPNYTFFGRTDITDFEAFNDSAILVSEVGAFAFSLCTGLRNVTMEYVNKIGRSAFKGCTALEEVHFLGNKFVEFGYGTFEGCTALTTVEMQKSVINLGLNYAFRNCTSLNKLILRWEREVVPIFANEFRGTCFYKGGSGGTVYVPESLIESYKTADGWSTLYGYGTCNFVAIEGSEYE